MKVRFKKRSCVTSWGQYSNGRIALVLLDEETGEPIAKVSVNVTILIPSTQIAVKSWSENEGMLEALMAAGVGTLNESNRSIDCGHAVGYRLDLSDEALKECREAGWKG